MKSYVVKLDEFEGPLDLLLYLIEKNELDICKISIAAVTKQYIEYIQSAKALDLEITSEFIDTAATLLSIKIKMLLPSDKAVQQGDDQEDEQCVQMLEECLLEYKRFKDAADFLKDCYKASSDIFTRGSNLEIEAENKKGLDFKVKRMDVSELVQAMKQLIKEKKGLPNFPAMDVEVKLSDKIDLLIKKLKSFKKGLLFKKELLEKCSSKLECIVTFLAVLELLKRGVIKAEQQDLFCEIILLPTQKLLASGGDVIGSAVSG